MTRKYPGNPLPFCDYTRTCHRTPRYEVTTPQGTLDYCRYHFRYTLLPLPEPAPDPDVQLLVRQLGTLG